MQKSLSIITQNHDMREIISRIDKVVDSDTPILLIGETGTGKEIFAEYIHRTSNRSENPFVKISLSALPADLLESELFGYERGSFTSAISEKKGLFEIANNGSIFLDDIDDVPVVIQKKLLRILESGELLKIGATKTIPINVRLITASKVDLKELVNKKRFRADLFYRINGVPIRIPPLRQRSDDISLLIEHFLKRFSTEKKIKVSQAALKKLIQYSWPGNVRELRNVIQRLSLFVEDEIKIDDLAPEIRNENAVENLIKACKNCYANGAGNFNDVVNCLEQNLIKEALEQSKGNKTQAAKILGLNPSTFRDKIIKLKIKANY